MNYICLKNQAFAQDSFQLVPFRYRDLLQIKNWRNEQIAVLRQNKLLTDEMQEWYYQTVIAPSFNEQQPDQVLFSFLSDVRCIGYGGLVRLDWHSKRGEVSFLLETALAQDPIKYRQHFAIFLQLIKEVAFRDLQLHRLYAETFDIRPLHVAVLEEEGFVFEGRMKEHVFTEGRFVDSLIHGYVIRPLA